MKIVQLIKITESILYLENGEIIKEDLTPYQKLLISIYGEAKHLRSEEVIERWHVKTEKEADRRFWDYMEENNIDDTRNYYLVF